MNIWQAIRSAFSSVASASTDWGGYESLRQWVTSNEAGVTLSRSEASKLAVVSRCVALLAETIGTLPMHVYEAGPKRVLAPDHPYQALLGLSPAKNYTASAFWASLLEDRLLRGIGLAWIERNGAGEPVSLTPIDPDFVTTGRFSTDFSRIWYAITLPNGKMVKVEADDVLHLPGRGFDGMTSSEPLKAGLHHSTSIGIAAARYQQRFFGKGANPDVVIEAPGKVDEKQVTMLRELWASRYAGLDNSHLPMMLTQGLKAGKLTYSARDAQIAELRTATTLDICRFFGVPPHLVGETTNASSFGTGIESMSTGFAMYTLSPLVIQLQQEVMRKLFRPDGRGRGRGFTWRISLQGLMRGDQTTRSEYYRAGLGGSAGPAWLTVNEVRAFEDMAPIEGGDTLAEWQLNTDPVIET